MAESEAIMNNLYGLYAELAEAAPVETGAVGGFRFIRCAGSVWPNMTYPGTNAAGLDIGELVAGIKAGYCPRLLAVEEGALRAEQLEQMHTSRFLGATQWANMAHENLPLLGYGHAPKDTEGQDDPADLDCRVIDAGNSAEWSEWSAIAEEVFFKKAKLADAIFRFGQEKAIFLLIAGFAGGRAVCISLLYLGKIAGVYMVATLAEFQGRGYGRTLMRFTASVAAERGYGSLVLHSTKRGLPLYNRMGFQTHGKLSLYYCLA